MTLIDSSLSIPDNIELWVNISTQSKKNEIIGFIDGRYKIKIHATPIDGKANAQLCEFLAKEFKTQKTKVNLLSGHTSKQKKILIQNPTILPSWYIK